MIGIVEIARLANVSRATVSRVLNKKGYVSPAKRARIEEVMIENDFKPNLFAMGMRTNRSYSIGIIFPDLSNPFLPEWYEVVERISRSSGYMNYICISDPKGETEEQTIDDLLARRIDGILLFSYRKDQNFLKKLRKISQNTPLVCCDPMFGSEGLSCVFANGRKGTYEATLHLIKSGRRRIAYIKGKADYQVLDHRFSGFQEALADSGLDFDENLIYEGEFKMDCGFKAAEKFMKLPSPPDAIMAGTDFMALGVLDYLNTNKFRIPGDVAVIGFDNLHFSQNSKPPLSTVAMPISEMAESSIKMLIEFMKDKHEHPIEKVFDTELIIRESSNI